MTSTFSRIFLVIGGCLLLSACGDFNFFHWFDRVSGQDRNGKQVVAGPLHAPPLNPRQDSPAMTGPLERDTPDLRRDPYDYYSRRAAADTAAPAQPPLPPPPRRMASLKPMSSVPTDTDGKGVRNVTVEPQPIAQYAAPDNGRKPLPENPPSGSWFPGLWGESPPPRDAADAAALKAPYPPLSSAPSTPPQLRQERDGRQQNMETLQSEHMQAQSDREALMSEPSGQSATAPVVAEIQKEEKIAPTPEKKPAAKKPAKKKRKKPAPKPKPEPVPAAEAPVETPPLPAAGELLPEAPPAPASTDSPALLGHTGDTAAPAPPQTAPVIPAPSVPPTEGGSAAEPPPAPILPPPPPAQ